MTNKDLQILANKIARNLLNNEISYIDAIHTIKKMNLNKKNLFVSEQAYINNIGNILKSQNSAIYNQFMVTYNDYKN